MKVKTSGYPMPKGKKLSIEVDAVSFGENHPKTIVGATLEVLWFC
jgi:hypothetical protein